MAADGFEHGRSDILPPFVRLEILNQWHLRLHHRDAGFFLKQTGNGFNLIAEPLECRLNAQHRQLQIQ